MLIHCNTPTAIILIPLRSAQGTWIFPSHPGPWAGLRLDVAPLQPVIPQIQDLASRCLGVKLQTAGYEVSPGFQEPVELPSGPATLYVVRPSVADKPLIDAESVITGSVTNAHNQDSSIRFATLPEWLSRMPATRQRLAWLRAWQVYQGMLEDQVKAVELDEAIKATLPRAPQP
jgi:hypothetical protein